MTVPLPALLLMIVALLAAVLTRDFRVGLETGLVALLSGFTALFCVLAVEGLVWMERRGVFLLDGDPPRGVAGPLDVVFDVFTTGMWIGHVITWVPAVLLGAAIGAAIGTRIDGRRRAVLG